MGSQDERLLLHGELGVRVRHTSALIPAGTILGFYSGHVCFATEVFESQFLADTCTEMGSNRGGADGVISCLESERLVESFTISFDIFNEECRLHGQHHDGQLIVCAKESGNEFSYLNDALLNPWSFALSHSNESVRVVAQEGYNAGFIEVQVMGFPFMAVVATTDLAPGEDLRAPWPDEYWMVLGEPSATSVTRARRLRQLRRVGITVRSPRNVMSTTDMNTSYQQRHGEALRGARSRLFLGRWRVAELSATQKQCRLNALGTFARIPDKKQRH